jgi:hypothetical protein
MIIRLLLLMVLTLGWELVAIGQDACTKKKAECQKTCSTLAIEKRGQCVTTCAASACGGPPPPSNGALGPMDVLPFRYKILPGVSPVQIQGPQHDDNGFLRNPVWRVPKPEACNYCPCRNDANAAVWNETVVCTTQTLSQSSGPVCGVKDIDTIFDGGDSGIGYHMNWFPVEYEGYLDWGGNSPWYKGDYDYTFGIVRDRGSVDDHALETWGRSGVHIEFDSRETVNHWDGTHTWWDAFHHNFVDTNQTATQQLIKDKFAIVIGMLGLDIAHVDHHSELHPVYAMFIKLPFTPTNSTGEVWAFFVRNWGNEGMCGASDVPMSATSISVRIPKHAASTNFSLNTPNVSTYSDRDGSACSQNEWSFTPTADGALLRFDLSDPSKHCGFVGDLRIDWGVPDSTNNPYSLPDKVVH